jgi:hypothetical protein
MVAYAKPRTHWRRPQSGDSGSDGNKTLGYNKSLEIRKLAVALHFGVYNFVLQRHAAAGNQTQPLMILYDIYCLMSL